MSEQPRWPELPPEQRRGRRARLPSLRQLDQAGERAGMVYRLVRRIGCLVLVLVVVAVIASYWARDRFDGGAPADAQGPQWTTTTTAPPASTGSPTLDRIDSLGILTVGVRELPGLAEREAAGNDFTGFDVALAEHIATELGTDPEAMIVKNPPAPVRERTLINGDQDLNLGGYEITDARRSEVDFAGPYLTAPIRLAVPADSPATGLDDLGDGNVCVAEGSAAHTALEPRLGEALTTRNTLEACADLVTDPFTTRVSGIADNGMALGAVLGDELRVVGDPLGEAEFGVGLPPGDPVLRDRITEILRDMIDDGTWRRLYTQHLGEPAPTPPRPR